MTKTLTFMPKHALPVMYCLKSYVLATPLPGLLSFFLVTLELPHCNMKRYRIAGNFRGPYILRIATKFIFAETNFVDCMIKATLTQVLLAAVSWP